MLTSIRCDQCGYESETRYRFCGMCGAKLPLPPYPVTETGASPQPERTEPARSVNAAPSFLGLNEEPTGSVTYLLEDELSTSRWGRAVVVIGLLAAVGIAGWHWRTQLRAYVTARLAEPNNNSAEAATSPPAPIPTSAPEAAPATPNASAPLEKPESVADLPASPPQSSAPPAPGQVALPPAPQSAKPDQSASNQAQAAPGEAPEAEPQPQVQKPSPVRPSADQLEAEGEKYLYGTGVPVNCDRAQKSLFAAAGQSNAKAYSVLGTMYATGHCADRDLPLAYHWFAKALHEDPANTRLQRDLQVLWSQMSADERQIAMSTRR